MGWDHGTYGWESYEAVVNGFKTLGISVEETFQELSRSRGRDNGRHRVNLRMATFSAPDGKAMVVEEYLALDDGDCDGMSRVDAVVYEQGNRPELFTQVLDGGHERYPEFLQDGERIYEFRYLLNDGTVHPLHASEDVGAWCAGCGRSLSECSDPESCYPDEEDPDAQVDEDPEWPVRPGDPFARQ
jgi:hypothetical protein